MAPKIEKEIIMPVKAPLNLIINRDILKNRRAEYGKQIVTAVAKHYSTSSTYFKKKSTEGMIMHDTALLAWVKSEKVFLKIQPGTGDNLLREDIRAGYVDYYLWSTFRPECIDIDGDCQCQKDPPRKHPMHKQVRIQK